MSRSENEAAASESATMGGLRLLNMSALDIDVLTTCVNWGDGVLNRRLYVLDVRPTTL